MIKCATGGQPLYFMKVRKARQCQACSPLKRKRAGLIAKYRKITAGGDESVFTQQSSELKSLKDTRLRICENAGVTQKAKFTCKDQLALKAAMKMTWAQSRTHRRFLHKLGISYDSEKFNGLQDKNYYLAVY